MQEYWANYIMSSASTAACLKYLGNQPGSAHSQCFSPNLMMQGFYIGSWNVTS